MACKRYLTDGIRVAAWHFWEFSTWGERYYFGWRGAREVRISMRGENCHMRLELPHKMINATRDENVYSRWTQGDFEWWRGVREVRICMQDENCQVRWELPHEMRIATRDENCHGRWEWSKRDTSHLVKFFTPWYLDFVEK